MPLDILPNIALSLFGLLQGSFLTSIPAYFLVLAGLFIKRRLDARYKFSWLKGSLLSTFLVVAAIVFVLYFGPLVSSIGEATIGIVPEAYSPTLQYVVLTTLGVPARLVLVALALALLLMPLELFGAFIHDSIKARWKETNNYVNIALCVFLTTVAASLLTLWLLPSLFGIDVITGVLYLIFFGT